MRAAAVVLVSSAVLLSVAARSAWAFEEYDGTRALGMGGASRAWAVGGSGPLLNPSGMSLVKAYSLEGGYAYTSRFDAQFLHASVVDSTSALGIAGGLYYTYKFDERAGVSGSGHEAGGALSVPLGQYVAVGATAKWFRLYGADRGPAPASSPATGGATFDAGVTVRPTQQLSLGVVAANLRDLHTGQAPRTVSYGVAFLPIPALVVALDGVTVLTADDTLGTKGTGVRAGAEWSLAQRVAFRLGGGTDAMRGVGFLSAGFSAVSEIGAVDLGVRGDLFPMKDGSSKNVFAGVSLRLFVPGAVESANAAPL
jgi:hypothetical protein